MNKTEHQIRQMQMGKGRCHHGGSTHTAIFTCSECKRTRSFNLNWLGHGGRIFCNGLKTAVMFAGAENNWDEKALFKPTAKQLEKANRRRYRKHAIRGDNGKFMRDWRADITNRMAAQSRAAVARQKAQVIRAADEDDAADKIHHLTNS